MKNGHENGHPPNSDENGHPPNSDESTNDIADNGYALLPYL